MPLLVGPVGPVVVMAFQAAKAALGLALCAGAPRQMTSSAADVASVPQVSVAGGASAVAILLGSLLESAQH